MRFLRRASHQKVAIYREDKESYLTGEEEETQPKKKEVPGKV